MLIPQLEAVETQLAACKDYFDLLEDQSLERAVAETQGNKVKQSDCFTNVWAQVPEAERPRHILWITLNSSDTTEERKDHIKAAQELCRQVRGWVLAAGRAAVRP